MTPQISCRTRSTGKFIYNAKCFSSIVSNKLPDLAVVVAGMTEVPFFAAATDSDGLYQATLPRVRPAHISLLPRWHCDSGFEAACAWTVYFHSLLSGTENHLSLNDRCLEYKSNLIIEYYGKTRTKKPRNNTPPKHVD
ncbi:hypothetical protein PCH_Pc12g09770 [Penicillium rubens Wisconsin 54-1255]|uniref:Uncharacterized protein n=1 Tax=Penicillium rubens (strain ATCC 28089 / DSM 1075 / NRRL 1951 / Wisconsin 54-1255) TaxID=500485 RepID=B6GZS6_PENRW|nr:hypothetical protein PCH_Pc12g09770 [Penicillium rubens Wisconsin 54-1255]